MAPRPYRSLAGVAGPQSCSGAMKPNVPTTVAPLVGSSAAAAAACRAARAARAWQEVQELVESCWELLVRPALHLEMPPNFLLPPNLHTAKVYQVHFAAALATFHHNVFRLHIPAKPGELLNCSGQPCLKPLEPS